MEGFGCDPAKIAAKDKTSQARQVGWLSVNAKAWELNVQTGRQAERTQPGSGPGGWAVTRVGGRGRLLTIR